MTGSANALQLAAAAQAVGIWEGQLLVGKYRVERVLGAGGMGVVVSARHLDLDERVAIKLLHPHAHGNPRALARFAREARAAAKIKSEHAARVSDVGTLENGTPYMVMEHLDGEDLSSVLRARGPLPWFDAVDFVLQACEALAIAHAHGIVHRDLKPANLFITRRADGTTCVKVLDFGISHVESDVSMTQTTQVLGTPLYMSPEQLSGRETVDARSDIWSLGVILFELVSGTPPFAAAGLPELVARVMTEPPPSLGFARGEGATALEAIIQRCLEKDRSLRYGSVAELARALHPFARGAAELSYERIAKILNAPVAEMETQPFSTETRGPPRTPTRRWWAVGALLLVGGALLALVRRGERTLPSPADSAALAPPTARPRATPAANPATEPIVEPVPAPPSAAALKRDAKVATRKLARPAREAEATLLEATGEVPASAPPPPPVDPFEDRK